MKRVFTLLIVSLMFLGGLSANYVKPGDIQTLEYSSVAATTLTSAVSTGWLKTGGLRDLALQLVFVDANSSITRLDWVCVGANDDDTPSGTGTEYTFQTISVSGGTVTYSDYAGQKAVAGSANLSVRVSTIYRWTECTFSSGAGTPASIDTLAIAPRAMN